MGHRRRSINVHPSRSYALRISQLRKSSQTARQPLSSTRNARDSRSFSSSESTFGQLRDVTGLRRNQGTPVRSIRCWQARGSNPTHMLSADGHSANFSNADAGLSWACPAHAPWIKSRHVALESEVRNAWKNAGLATPYGVGVSDEAFRNRCGKRSVASSRNRIRDVLRPCASIVNPLLREQSVLLD